MAKKEKKPKESGGVPSWLITFSDMMTLMLTFFVLLVSMSVMDERRKMVVLGSIISSFGFGQQSIDVLSQRNRKITVEPGPIEDDAYKDLEPLREMVWEDATQDLNFASNKFVQVLSIPDDILFEPGSVTLHPRGIQTLERTLPVLLQVASPLLLAGHTSILRDELGLSYQVEEAGNRLDPSWKLSFGRVMTVYQFLIAAGLNPELLRVEAFGKFHPRFSETQTLGRQKNRRVDIILDKRNAQWTEQLGMFRKSDEPESDFTFKEFTFTIEEKFRSSADDEQ